MSMAAEALPGHNSAPDYDRITVKPLAGACGAEIENVDLNNLDDATFDEIHRAFLEHQVIFFRDQVLDIPAHKAFARRFGTLNVHPQYVPLDGDPEIFPIIKEPTDADNIGASWHSDVTFLPEPALGSALYALEVPDFGGDTMFANQYRAYETLSDGMKEMLGNLKAWHSDKLLSDPEIIRKRNETRSTKVAEEAIGKDPIETLHPVVRTHPETGRKSLFVNAAFTIRFEDMTEEESKPLLQFLYAHAARPELTCRFRWTANALAFWDNRCLQHFALNDYPGKRRLMHRVTVNGDRPR